MVQRGDQVEPLARILEATRKAVKAIKAIGYIPKHSNALDFNGSNDSNSINAL